MNPSREGTVSLSTQASEKSSVRGLGSNSNTTETEKLKNQHIKMLWVTDSSAWEIGNILTPPNCLQDAWLDTFVLLQTVSLKTPLFLIFQGAQKRNMKKRSLLWKCRGLQPPSPADLLSWEVQWISWWIKHEICSCRKTTYKQEQKDIFNAQEAKAKDHKVWARLSYIQSKLLSQNPSVPTKSPHIHICVRVYMFTETEAPSVAEAIFLQLL